MWGRITLNTSEHEVRETRQLTGSVNLIAECSLHFGCLNYARIVRQWQRLQTRELNSIFHSKELPSTDLDRSRQCISIAGNSPNKAPPAAARLFSSLKLGGVQQDLHIEQTGEGTRPNQLRQFQPVLRGENRSPNLRSTGSCMALLLLSMRSDVVLSALVFEDLSMVWEGWNFEN